MKKMNVVKSLKVIVIIFSAVNYLTAQYVTVSNDISINRETYYELLGKYGKEILLLEETPTALTMRKLDENLNLTGGKRLELGFSKTRVISYVAEKKSFNVIFASYSRDSINVIQHKYDPQGNKLLEANITLIYKPLINPRFEFIISEDKKLGAVYKAGSKSSLDIYGWNMETGESLYTRTIDLSALPVDLANFPLHLDNKGNLYFSYETFVQNSKSLRKLVFVKLDPFAGSLTEQEIMLNDLFITDSKIIIDNLNHELNLIGLYSNKRYGANLGSLMIKLDNSFQRKPPIVTNQAFGKQLLSDYHGEKIPNAMVIPNLQVKELILRQDGGVMAILEDNKEFARRNFVGRRDIYGMGPANYSVDYYYEDLIAITYSPTGKIHWEKVLPKRQYSFDDEALYSSFFLLKTPKSLRLLYNDEIRNESTVSEYIIEGNGGIKRKALVSTENQNLKLQLRNSLQVGANEVIIPSIRGRKLRFVRIIYPPEQIN